MVSVKKKNLQSGISQESCTTACLLKYSGDSPASKKYKPAIHRLVEIFPSSLLLTRKTVQHYVQRKGEWLEQINGQRTQHIFNKASRWTAIYQGVKLDLKSSVFSWYKGRFLKSGFLLLSFSAVCESKRWSVFHFRLFWERHRHHSAAPLSWAWSFFFLRGATKPTRSEQTELKKEQRGSQ